MAKITWSKQGQALVIKASELTKAGKPLLFLLSSDEHLDNKKCERDRLKKDYDKVCEKGGYIINFGDFLDVMGGKWDKRSGKADILPELNTDTYFDDVVGMSVGFLKPYAKNIIQLADGNHELSIQTRHEVSLLNRIARELNEKHGANIIRQGYSGWIVYSLSPNDSGTNSARRVMYYTHGNGGNAPVTKGTIQSARRSDIIDADIIVSGHIHTDYVLTRPRLTLNQAYNMAIREQLHIQLGTYKNSAISLNGWETQKGFSPPSIGGTFLQMQLSYIGENRSPEVKFSATRNIF